MTPNKSEIAEALEHQQKMQRYLRQRLQQRELQEAQLGINTPPEVMVEIRTLTERIQTHDAELARLHTLAAEDQFPIAEVEYRAFLATAWSIPEERYTVAVVAQLELQRLQLGIAPDRAQEIEQTIRIALARETFHRILTDMFSYTPTISRLEWSKVFDSKPDILADQNEIDVSHDIVGIAQSLDQLLLIGRCIHIDPVTTADLFVKSLPIGQARIMGIADSRYEESIQKQLQTHIKSFLPVLDLKNLKQDLLHYNNIWPDEEIRSSFDDFIDRLETALADRQPRGK